MNKQQAQQCIKDTFEAPFDKVRFSVFVRNLLNHIEDAPFTYQGNYIPEKFRQYIKSLERIGKYSDGEQTLDILIITLKKEMSLGRARTMQRNLIAWYLNGSRGDKLKDAALVAYVSPDQTDWRFSLVKMDYKFEKTKTGKMKVREEFTPARRWSFLVGANEKSHTAQSRLVKILADDEHAPTLAELEEAFNIETVTKEFFLKYRELFIRTKEALDKVVKKDSKVKADFDAKGVDTVNFAKKLLGQIVFLCFLQKKGWFGVSRDDDWGTGSKQFLRELFEGKHGGYQNFFNDILEPLFYEALRIDRSHDDHYYSRFNCKIPFLNGGLFDPIGNYDWVHADINLLNDLFSNTRKTKDGDIGDGILDMFDRYNFTVREDEPLEKEVAIDPELLGKAYEKFNAIRPDNFDEFVKALKSGKTGEENKFNKKFGVYYTPREIVHYMCQQSLINYLYTQAEESGLSSAIKKQDIEDLIEVGEMITEHEATALIKEKNIKNGIQKSTEYTALLSDSIRRNAKYIDDWLADITVCDPAAGSGAFPVGMMTEIVRARNVLSVFLNNQQRNDYEFKRRCIEHSLYGVDIDPGAVEIAKLRLWLSLVVDEENIRQIKPLPNLDYKIMQGNSLIELLSSEMGGSTDYNRTKLVQNLKQAKGELFDITNPAQKENKRSEINKLIRDLIEYDRKKQIERLKQKIKAITSQQKLFEDAKEQKEEKEKVDKIKAKISEIDDLDFPGQSEHFEWHINFSDIFQEKGGFDVVIANPPYVQIKNIPWNERKVFEKTFKSAVGRFNIFYFFLEIAGRLAKESGFSTFIIPDRLLLNTQCGKLREWLIKDQTILEIDSFRDGVFDAVVDSIIVFYQNVRSEGVDVQVKNKVTLESLYENPVSRIPVSYFLESPSNQFDLSFKPSTDNLIEKIKSVSISLGDISDIKDGIIQGKVADKLFLENPIDNHSKPLLFGEDVTKYSIKFNRNWVNYKPSEMMKLEVKRRGEGIRHGLWMRTPNIFERLKILTRQTADEIIAAYDTQNYYYSNTLHGTAVIDNNYNPFYILALMNSRLMTWYYRSTTAEEGKVFAQIKISILRLLPIKQSKKTEQKPFIDLVDKILAITKADDYPQNPQKQARVKELEREIDQLVYQLYGLTEDEIRIVEGEGK